MCYVEGTPGSIIFARETPVNIKMHYVLEIIGNMMCPVYQKLQVTKRYTNFQEVVSKIMFSICKKLQVICCNMFKNPQVM